jgi:hypothetical protein
MRGIETRDAQDIVDDANALARGFADLIGLHVPEGYRFDRATRQDEAIMWDLAVFAYGQIESTDVLGALNAIGM